MVVIVAARRSPMGKFMGSLSSLSAPEIAAQVIKGVLNDVKLKPKQIDEVIIGNVLQAGIGQNPARQAALKARLPNTTRCVTINKVCGSGMKAIQLAVQAIECGKSDIVIAGGMESMSKAPRLLYYGRTIKKFGNLKLSELQLKDIAFEDSMIHDGLSCPFTKDSMGFLAEQLRKKYKIPRQQQDEFSLESHKRAANSNPKKEITTIKVKNKPTLIIDETVRPNTSLEKLKTLKPVFAKKGTITAGNASSLADGAAILILMSNKMAKKLKLKPLAKINEFSEHSLEPKWYTLAPVETVKKLKRKKYDLIEINEAFAIQTLAVMKALKLPKNKVNIRGGAIALGHPIGCSGARIVVTLIHSLIEKKKKHGLATLCIGGGEAIAMSITI
ncbi:MAG: thiolase family protein [Candidatus Nanoarchaeia archaeon]